MKSALIVLTLLGCDCDGVACEYIRTVPGDWSSVESCEASSDFRRTTAEAASYPLVVVRCSVDGGDRPPLEAAGSGDAGGQDAVAGAQPADAGGKAGRAMSGWMSAENRLRGLLVTGASHSIRAAGSGIATYASHAGEPVRSIAGRVFAGLRD